MMILFSFTLLLLFIESNSLKCYSCGGRCDHTKPVKSQECNAAYEYGWCETEWLAYAEKPLVHRCKANFDPKTSHIRYTEVQPGIWCEDYEYDRIQRREGYETKVTCICETDNCNVYSKPKFPAPYSLKFCPNVVLTFAIFIKILIL